MTTADDEIRSELFQALLNHSPAAILFVDSAERIRYWTRSTESLLGVTAVDIADYPGLRCALGLDSLSKERGESICPNSEVTDADSALTQSVQTTVLDSAGNRIWVERVGIPLVIAGRSWQMVFLKTASALDSRYAELERQAHTDPLSELFNRRGFQRALESNQDKPLTLGIVDVDFFKRINDQFGHPTGDQAIRWVAKKLRDSFRDSVCIGRLGGDEFGVILSSRDIAEARLRFQTFCTTVENDRSACPLGLTISIGVAVATKPGVLPRELLSLADQAMYLSKQEGRNRVTVVDVGATP